MNETRYVIEVTQENFQHAVIEASHTQPVLVDFWAAWCNPCKMLVPLLEKLAGEYQGAFILAKADTDQERELADRHAIRSIPTVILFSRGEEITRFNGVIPEVEIRALIDAVIPCESDSLLDRAQSAFKDGERDQGLALTQRAVTLAPEKYRIALRAAELMMDGCMYAEAGQILKALPLDLQMDPSLAPMQAKLTVAEIIREAPGAGELARALENDPKNKEAAYLLAAHKALDGEHEAALRLLLDLLRRDPGFREGAARKAMVRIFEILGNGGELVQRYRMELARALH